MCDTIAAIATAYGEGGIGIVRISGSEAFNILNRIFLPFSGNLPESRKLTYGHIADPATGVIVDEVMACYMKAPHTYTREDVVEINCHGSIVSLKNTLSLVLETGARPAEPGEFTKRAFLNGRLDLSQAEAVIDLIRSKTDTGFELAMNQLEGGLSADISGIRKKLVDILVDVTVNIDYPDEDIEILTYRKLSDDLTLVRNDIDKLLSTAGRGRIMREGIRACILGRPNVGKSSFMNFLLRENRAIVTDIPGTTRDVIEETVNIGGIPLILTDTAGIRETSDVIEQIGIEKSKASFNEADFAFLILDGSRRLEPEDYELIDICSNKTTLVLINKSDIGSQITREEISEIIPDAIAIETSITEKSGTDEVIQAVNSIVFAGDVKTDSSSIVSNARHEDILKKALKAIEDALSITEMNQPLEFIEVDINEAFQLLGEITGDTASDQIINEVFSRFCLGK